MKYIVILLLGVFSSFSNNLPPEAQMDFHIGAMKNAIRYKKFDKANQELQKALSLKVSSVPNQLNFYRGKLLFEKKQYKESKKYIDIYIKQANKKDKLRGAALALLYQLDIEVKKVLAVEKAEFNKKNQKAQKIYDQMISNYNTYKSTTNTKKKISSLSSVIKLGQNILSSYPTTDSAKTLQNKKNEFNFSAFKTEITSLKQKQKKEQLAWQKKQKEQQRKKEEQQKCKKNKEAENIYNEIKLALSELGIKFKGKVPVAKKKIEPEESSIFSRLRKRKNKRKNNKDKTIVKKQNSEYFTNSQAKIAWEAFQNIQMLEGYKGTKSYKAYINGELEVDFNKLKKRIPFSYKVKKHLPDLEMVKIQAGSFTMGGRENGDEKPRHKVKITKGFWMGKYEVTQKQWKAIMGNNPSYFKGDDLPVEQVSWNDIKTFIKKLNKQVGCSKPDTLSLVDNYGLDAVPKGCFRLPTEAEWEYAARSETNTKYSWGNNIDSSKANYNGNINKTTNVGKYSPNKWGLYDIHGNVWEWCHDWYDSNYYNKSSELNPVNTKNGFERVLRGGSWYFSASYLRSADRCSSSPDGWIISVGFRLLAVQ